MSTAAAVTATATAVSVTITTEGYAAFVAVRGEGFDEAKKHFQRCMIESESMIVQMATADLLQKVILSR